MIRFSLFYFFLAFALNSTRWIAVCKLTKRMDRCVLQRKDVSFRCIEYVWRRMSATIVTTEECFFWRTAILYLDTKMCAVRVAVHMSIYIAQMREQFTYTGLSWNSCKCLNTSQYDPKKTLNVITDERRFRYLSLNSSKFGLWFMRFFSFSRFRSRFVQVKCMSINCSFNIQFWRKTATISRDIHSQRRIA